MWYYAANNLTHGPVSERELQTLLKRKAITTQTLVWRDDAPERLPLEKTGLAAKFEIPLPDGEQWRTCAFSGAMVRESEMCLVDDFRVAKACRAEAQAFVDAGGWMPNLIRSRHFPTRWQRFCRGCRHLRDGIVDVIIPACGLYLLINIPLQLGLAWANARFVGQGKPVLDAVFALELLLQVAVLSLPMAAVLFLFKEDARGRHPGFAKALTTGFALWGRMAVTNLVLTVILSAWWLVQYLPGPQDLSRDSLSVIALFGSLYFWLRLAHASVIVVDKKADSWEALKLSWQLRNTRELLPGCSVPAARVGVHLGQGTDLSLMFFMAAILRYSGLLLSAPPAIVGFDTSTITFCLRGLLNLCYIFILFHFYAERTQRNTARQSTRLAV